MGLLDGVKWLLRLSDLIFACTQNHPTYATMTLEFLSLYSYDTPTNKDMYLTGTIKFLMFNTEYALTQEQISDLLQFPRGGSLTQVVTVHSRIPSEADWATAVFDQWRHIIGEETTSWDDLYASHIHNPIIRYFFKILYNSIFGRFNNKKLNSKELFFLHCVFAKDTKINASLFLLHHIESLSARGNQPFLIRGLATMIAHCLNLGGNLRAYNHCCPYLWIWITVSLPT